VEKPEKLFALRRQTMSATGEITTRTDQRPICHRCLQNFSSQEAYDRHSKSCHTVRGQLFTYPAKGDVVQFTEKDRLRTSFRHAFVIFFDFECLQATPENGSCSCPPEVRERKVTPLTEEEEVEEILHYRNLGKPVPRCNHSTRTLKVHKPFSFALIAVDREWHIVERHTYSGLDAAAVFINTILDVEERLLKKLREDAEPIILTDEIRRLLKNIHVCHLCKKPLGEDVVSIIESS